MISFPWLKKQRLNEQLKFFSAKRFVSVYAKKPRIRVVVDDLKIYSDNFEYALVTHNPLSAGNIIKYRGSIPNRNTDKPDVFSKNARAWLDFDNDIINAHNCSMATLNKKGW